MKKVKPSKASELDILRLLVDQLERRISALEARPVYPVWQPSPFDTLRGPHIYPHTTWMGAQNGTVGIYHEYGGEPSDMRGE